MKFTLDEIRTALGLSIDAANKSSLPLRIITDSREAGPATIFWALRGEAHDGHAFVDPALAAGSDAAVVDLFPLPSGESSRPDQAKRCSGSFGSRDTLVPEHLRSAPGSGLLHVADTLAALQTLATWNRQRHATKVVGITGSFGKTTTREIIHAALQYEVPSHRSPRNFNNHFGVPLTLLGLTAQHKTAIVELGASAHGEVRRLSEIASPEIGIITGIGQAHRATFGDANEIARAKGELAESLPADGLLLLCGDDAHSQSIAERTSARVAFVGTTPECHVQARSIHQEGDRLSIRVEGTDFRVQSIGRHFARSVLFAIVTAREFGLTDQQIATGLADFQAPAGRCSVEMIGSWTVIDDSYNASPEAFAAACGLLGGWPTDARRILVCGDMLELGEAASACHQDAGVDIARAGIDRVLALGDFSREVVESAVDAGLDPNFGEAFGKNELPSQLHRLQQILRPGDVILVKGSRGMRMERVIEWLRSEAAVAGNETAPQNEQIPSLFPKSTGGD